MNSIYKEEKKEEKKEEGKYWSKLEIYNIKKDEQVDDKIDDFIFNNYY